MRRWLPKNTGHLAVLNAISHASKAAGKAIGLQTEQKISAAVFYS